MPCLCLCALVCDDCMSVMGERVLVLVPVIFNPSPEARISSSLSHRPQLSLAEHLVMRDLINTGMAILFVTEGDRPTVWESQGRGHI